MQRALYLICYDISCTRRWRRVHRLLKSFRVEGQKSVFECLLSPGELREVVERLDALIHHGEDRVHLLRLDPRMACEGWCVARSHRLGQPLTVL